MFWQEIMSIYSIAKENFVVRGLDFFMGKVQNNSSLENVERNFKALKARADDLEKDISNQGDRKRKREEVVVWFRDVKRVKREYIKFKKEEKVKGFLKKIFDSGDQQVQLNARIRELDDRSRHFGELVVGDNVATRGRPRPTKGMEGEAFQENFQRIWNLLENDEGSRIGIHGMGGVGKSTLVEHIYNQLLKNGECVYWVVVSQGCSIKMLQDKIAYKLELDLSKDENDEGARAGTLNQALSQRKNLMLILDDMWEHIDLVKVGVPGCKWMMTSRSFKLCQEMNCQEIIAVKPLSKDEGWNLFLKNLGQDTTSGLGDPEVEKIAKRAMKICGGLPLGIITLAGAMSGVTEIHEWRHALRVLEESALGYDRMEEKVFPVLKYSFDQLKSNDQRCFLYCSLYPEDHQIPKEELVKKFLSEELVDKRKSMAAQRDEGHSVLTRLVKVSLLESVSNSYKGECVKMHDLVRAMAHKITEGKTMVIAGQYSSRKQIPIEDEWTYDLEKVSLMKNEIEEIPLGISPNCPKLTTLLLQNNYPLKQIATSFFTQMCGLCALDLSGTCIRKLPDSVSNLVNLTSLLLGRCYELRRVPCVRNLKELKELDLSNTSIEDVPQGLEELVNIRCLSMDGTRNLSRTSLVLKSPWVQLLRLPYTIEADQLVEGGERLEVFEGWLKDMSHFNRLAACKQDGISYLIVVSGSGDKYAYFGEHDGKNRLIVSSYKFNKGVENDSTILAEFIQHLEIKLCEGMGKCLLDDLSSPASLKELKVSHSRGIECILTYSQFKSPQESKSQFQALETIELLNLQDFKGLIYSHEVEAEAACPPLAFSSLRKLTISKCNKMKKLGLTLSLFEKLEYISIRECEEIEEIIQVAATADDDDDAISISLPNLKYLSLVGLPSLESFCDAPVICNSIETLEFKDCPRLEDMSLNRGTQDSYEPLFARTSSSTVKKEWWELDLFRYWSR